MALLEGWTVLFDLDGTLVDSAPDLLASLNHTLATLDVAPVELPTVRTMIGHGAKAMIRKGLTHAGRPHDEKEIEALWYVFIEHYQANIAIRSAPFDGGPAALGALRAQGCRLGVCTNKTQALAERLLGALALDHHFDAIVGADIVSAKKPDPAHLIESIARLAGDPARAIMVGDSRTDERAARGAGLPFVFVPFGYETESVEQLNPDGLVSHYSALLPVLQDLAAQAANFSPEAGR